MNFNHYAKTGRRRVVCGNCSHVCTERAIKEVCTEEIDGEPARNLHGRLNAGDTVPVGECPKCGSWAYVVTDKTLAEDRAGDMLDLIEQIAKGGASKAQARAAEFINDYQRRVAALDLPIRPSRRPAREARPNA